ncbi:MAG: AAA family ATPase [Sulfitobacter sp.]
MYETHFDLKLFPFKVTPDPAFIYWNRQHRRAASILELGFAQLAPLSVLTGDVGAGKTTLLLHFLNKKPDVITVGLISNFSSGLGSLYEWILNAFDIPLEANEIDCLEAFQQFAISEYAAGRRCVLVVDEAQNLSDSDLERLRMLTNINSGKDVLLMLFLVGQPQLREHLMKPSNRQIAQRIGPTFNLGPMGLKDTQAYVRHRISVAGGKNDIFDDDAIALVHRQSGGVPRLINVVCEMAMVSAYGEGTKRIDGAFMQSFLDDVDQSGLLASTPEPYTEPAIPERTVKTPFETIFFDDPDADPDSDELEDQHQVVPFPQSEGIVLKEPEQPAPKDAQSPDEATPAPSQTAAVDPLPAPQPSDLQGADEPSGGKSGGRLKFMAGAAVAAVAFFAVSSVPHLDRQPVEMANLDAQTASTNDSTQMQSNLPATLPETIAPFDNMTGAALLDSAIESGVTNPKAAAIAYARAALRGENTAAYYLGQLYETGDGVTRDLAQARAWYTVAQESVRGARRRLGDLGPPEQSGDMTPPVLLLGGPVTGGGAEFVWTSGEGADPAYYVVELSAGQQEPVTRLAPQKVSALRIDALGDARIWRVLAVDAALGRYTVSDWMPLGNLNDPASLGSGPVNPDVIVTAPSDVEPDLLAPATQPLRAANISFSTIKDAVEQGEQAQVRYYFDADEDAAQEIATLLDVPAGAMRATADPDGAQQPLPGQITVIPAAG